MITLRALIPFALLLLPVLPVAAQDVGVAAAVNQSAQGIRNTVVRTIGLGDNVIYNERIDTNSDGLVQLLLADGTTFTVGPNSSLVIDSFVYNPDAGTAQVAATLTKGVLRFIGAATSKTPDGVSITTPVGVVGIRGGVTDINMNPPSGIPPHISMIFGNSVTLTNGGELLGRLFEAGFSLALTGGGIETIRTPSEWASIIQQALSSGPGQKGGAPQGANNGQVQTVADVNSNQNPPIPPIPMDPIDRPSDLGDDVVDNATGNDVPDGSDPGGGPSDPVVVETVKGVGAGVLVFTTDTPSDPPFGLALGLLSDPTGTTQVEIGFDAGGNPVAGKFPLYFDACAGCYFVFDTATDTVSFAGAPIADATFTVNNTILDHTQAVLPNNVPYCTCAFLDWGLWTADYNITALGYSVDLAVGGQWATGDTTTPAQLDNLAQTRNTTATYEGNAIGTVSPDFMNGAPTHTAAGALAMDWNFATRDGTIAINNFDGDNYTGNITGTTGFEGDIANGNATADGFVNGVFVNDGANLGAGVMGTFNLSDGVWGATGILIGQEVP